MRSITSSLFRLLMLFSLLGAASAFGQEPRIRLDELDRLTAHSTEAIDINIDGALLKLVPKILIGAKSPGPARFKELISGLDGIYIRRYEFDKEGGYRTEDVEMIRAQVRPPAWTKVAGVRAGRGRNHVEAYVRSEGNNITGITIISAEPRELVVANIIGIIDIDKLAELFREIDLEWLEWTEPRKREKE